MNHAEMRTLSELADLERLVESEGDERLYVRWSKGPSVDMEPGERSTAQSSKDGLTGVELPGLSANPLRVQQWWGDRSLRLWLARRLYDYRHLQHQKGPGVRPWVLEGEEQDRGPDNEPLVVCRRPLAWIADEVLEQAEQLVAEQGSADWGPLDRGS